MIAFLPFKIAAGRGKAGSKEPSLLLLKNQGLLNVLPPMAAVQAKKRALLLGSGCCFPIASLLAPLGRAVFLEAARRDALPALLSDSLPQSLALRDSMQRAVSARLRQKRCQCALHGALCTLTSPRSAALRGQRSQRSAHSTHCPCNRSYQAVGKGR